MDYPMVFIIPGEAPFLNETYKGARGRLVMNEVAKTWKQNVGIFLQSEMKKRKYETMAVFCRVNIFLYRPNRRSDIDASNKIILDTLQAAGVLKNDNLVDELFIRKIITPNDAKVIIEVLPLKDGKDPQE